jgi:hypothetical protein
MGKDGKRMSIYSAGVRSINITAGTMICRILSASTDRPKIMEIGVTLVTATAVTIGLGTPATAGSTVVTSVTVLPEDINYPAGTCTIITAQTTVPSAPANYFRRVGLPATIGAGIVWTFPQGLVPATSGSIVLWNITTGPLMDVWVVVDE